MRTLSRTKVSTIKRHFAEWHRRERAQDALPLEMDQDLLMNFFDFLGFKDSDFNGLPEKVYDTSVYQGTKMIEDFMRKKLFKGEEKVATRQKPSTKKKAPASKAVPAKT